MPAPVEALNQARASAVPPVAVIDIGSNSVRLVVFDGLIRSPSPKFNEKVLCGLGRKLSETGELDASGMAQTLTAMQRFVALARLMHCAEIKVVATAAVRDANNGRAFVTEIERQNNIRIRILSGTEEAELSAQGVVSGMPDADGIMGDLGGGSLELVGIDKGMIGDKATLPLGPFRLQNLGPYPTLRDHIDKQFASVRWLNKAKGRRLHIVGGAWRAIARIHMAQHNYPLRIIHHYRLTRLDAEEITRLLSRQSRDSLSRIDGVPRRRQDSLPAAALVLRRLIKLLEPSDVVFSAQGLREGLCFAGLPERARKEDPLLAACREMAIRDSRFGEQGNELSNFVAPLFEREDAERKRLRLAAAYLSDISWRVHPDYRGEQAIGRILHAPFVGVDHPGRAMLGLAIFARYQGTIDHDLAQTARLLLDEPSAAYARDLGFGLRLAHTLAGGTGVLPNSRLRLTQQNLVLDLPANAEPLIGESVVRRLEALAKAVLRQPELRVAGKAR